MEAAGSSTKTGKLEDCAAQRRNLARAGRPAGTRTLKARRRHRKEDSRITAMNQEQRIDFRMEAVEKSLLSLNSYALAAGGLFILVLLLLRNMWSIPTFLVMFLILFLYLAWDCLNWNKNGIRTVELKDGAFIFYRGNDMKATRVNYEEVSDINFFGKSNRRVINILLQGGKAFYPLPGITLFSGPRIRITDEAFDEHRFTRFMEILRDLKRGENEIL
jgi:hypothetical protein